jgi:hypothetical protein
MIIRVFSAAKYTNILLKAIEMTKYSEHMVYQTQYNKKLTLIFKNGL